MFLGFLSTQIVLDSGISVVSLLPFSSRSAWVDASDFACGGALV